MFVEIVEINVPHVVHQQIPLILFGFVWIVIENIIQNVLVADKPKKDKSELVRFAIPVIR